MGRMLLLNNWQQETGGSEDESIEARKVDNMWASEARLVWALMLNCLCHLQKLKPVC